MTSWLETIAEKIAHSGAVARVVVIRADGSTPREAGAAMVVTEQDIEGTIGGGTLELEAIIAARAMLKKALAPSAGDAAWCRETRDYPLGPSLGQCCGGAAKVLFELFTSSEARSLRGMADRRNEPGLLVHPLECGNPLRLLTDRKEAYAGLPMNALRVTRDMLSGARPPSPAFIPGTKGASACFIEPLSPAKTPLYVYGAGHVGRALVRILENLPFTVVWIDTAEARFPSYETPGVTRVVAHDPATSAATAECGVFHLVMTYSHPLDLGICHAILKSGSFGFLGLIGSATKRARFTKRLRELGHEEALVRRMICPIGIPGLSGKEPATIAVSAAAQLLTVAAQMKSAHASPRAAWVSP
jgi:xanthine dehydrogenase accessory factor